MSDQTIIEISVNQLANTEADFINAIDQLSKAYMKMPGMSRSTVRECVVFYSDFVLKEPAMGVEECH